MTDKNTDLKNCPVCADSRVSPQEHSGWHWVTCAICHYRGPAMLDVVSAIVEYNAQRDIIAQYLVSRSDLAAESDALKADNDAHVTVRDKVRATLGCEPHDGVSDAAQRVVAERDALSAELAALKKRVAAAPRGEAAYLSILHGESLPLCVCVPKHLIGQTVAILRLEDGE